MQQKDGALGVKFGVRSSGHHKGGGPGPGLPSLRRTLAWRYSRKQARHWEASVAAASCSGCVLTRTHPQGCTAGHGLLPPMLDFKLRTE